jgi:hypothetical protein
MTAIYGSGTVDQGRSDNRIDLERFYTGAGSSDVCNRIQSSYFVETDIFDWNRVDLSLSIRDALEYGDATRLDKVAQPAVFNQAADLSKVAAMRVLGVARMTPNMNLKFASGDALTHAPRKLEIHGFREAELRDRSLENILLDTEVAKGRYCHVSANA